MKLLTRLSKLRSLQFTNKILMDDAIRANLQCQMCKRFKNKMDKDGPNEVILVKLSLFLSIHFFVCLLTKVYFIYFCQWT